MNENKISDKEMREILQKRIAFVKQMIEIGKLRIEEPYTKDHWEGYLAALSGTTGELQFLEKLYARF